MGQIKLSILSPCYNGEKFIKKYFENLLEQSFREYEVIIVNDGSKDKSDEIIVQYKQIFERRGIQFKYLNKKINEGHAKAINDGLKYVDGEYLMWPDIDDHMHRNHLECRVNFMEKNHDCDLAIGKSAVFNINNLENPLYYAWKKFPKTKNILIKTFMLSESKNIGFMSGTFIVRTSKLWDIYKERNIYSEIKVGPTIQMIFPILYLSKTGYINECTFDYYIHGNNQHLVNEKHDFYNIQVVYDHVIDHLKVTEKEANKLKNIAKIVSDRLILSYALKTSDRILGNEAWRNLKIDQGIRLKEIIKYMLIKNSLLHNIYIKIFRREV